MKLSEYKKKMKPELENRLDTALHATEKALDEMRKLSKNYMSIKSQKIERLLTEAFYLLDDEQQDLADKLNR